MNKLFLNSNFETKDIEELKIINTRLEIIALKSSC